MANYLVASGSRKISQLEVATNPVPAGSSSIMPLVIGDAIPITNGTTVQITPDNFLSNLVFDASETYTGGNTFSGNNTLSGTNTFTGVNNQFTEQVVLQKATGDITLLNPNRLEIYSNGGNFDTLVLKTIQNGGVKFEDYSFDLDQSSSFMEVGTNQGNIQFNRETHFSNDVYITGSLRVQEVFYVFETASILNSSGSTIFGDTGDDTHQFSGSILLSGSLAIIDGATLDGVDLSVFKTDYDTASGSFSTRVTTNETDISNLQTDSGSFSTRVTAQENFSSSQYNSESSSFETRVTDLESFSSSLDDTYATDAELASVSQSFESDIDTLSGSFSTRVTTNETDISNLQTDSGSFSTRVTTNETDISNLQTDSGSFSTRVTAQENFSSSQYNAESSSFSADITENSQSLSLLSASFETTSSKLIDASGSFSTRVTNNELTGSDHEDRIVKGTNAVTSSAVSSSYIDLDVLANGDIPAHKAGRIFFGSEDGALEVYNEEADFTLQVGQEFVVRAFNKSGGVIGNGTPVYASGSQGDRIGIYPATAEDHTSGVHYENHIIGIATHEIGINSEGYVTAQGIVRGIDTQNFTAGDTLYLQTGSPATPEDYYRNTPPPFPYDIVQVGYVSRVAANGFVFADPKEPVHFSNISGLSGSFTPQVGDLWVYQENNGWSTTHNLTGSYTIGGDLLPETTEVHDLGSPSLRWRDLYLSGSTIDLGGLLIQRNSDGNVQFIDSASQATKSVTIDSITGSLTVTENLTVGGNLTAQQFITEYVSSSILYESGSTKFGDTSDDKHEFTGSVDITGSLIVDGSVGFGVDTPIRKYHFDGGSISTDTPTLRISSTDSAGTNKFGIEFFSNNGADVRGKILADNNGRVYIDDNGGGGVALQSGGGNVMIGTTTPLATAANRGNLTINGTNTSILSFGTSDALKSYVYNDGTDMKINTGDGILVVESQNVETLYVNSGSVNIKGQNPSVDGAILTLENSDTSILANQTLGYLNFYTNDTSTTSAGGVGGIVVKAETNFDTSLTPTYMSFFTHDAVVNDGSTLGNVSEAMRLDSDRVLSLPQSSNNGTFNFNGTAMELDVNRHPETGVFSDTGKSHARISLNGANGGSEISFATSNANNTTATAKVTISGSGEVQVGTTSVTSNGVTIEKSGNHVFLRATTAPAGEYWNFDIDSNNRLNVINDNSVGVYIDDGATSWTGTSDERLKNINYELTGSLSNLQDLRAVNYSWVSGSVDKNFYGLIAQDVEEHYSDMISEDRDGYKGIRYTEMIPVLVSAIKEQQEIINDLKSRIETLENQ